MYSKILILDNYNLSYLSKNRHLDVNIFNVNALISTLYTYLVNDNNYRSTIKTSLKIGKKPSTFCNPRRYLATFRDKYVSIIGCFSTISVHFNILNKQQYKSILVKNCNPLSTFCNLWKKIIHLLQPSSTFCNPLSTFCNPFIHLLQPFIHLLQPLQYVTHCFYSKKHTSP